MRLKLGPYTDPGIVKNSNVPYIKEFFRRSLNLSVGFEFVVRILATLNFLVCYSLVRLVGFVKRLIKTRAHLRYTLVLVGAKSPLIRFN